MNTKKNFAAFLALLTIGCKSEDRKVIPTSSPALFAVRSPKGDFTGSIEKIDLKTGQTLKSISIKGDPAYEEGLAYDGHLLYYINGRTDLFGINKVIRFNPESGQPIDTFATAFPPRMDALAINKKDLFVLDFLLKKIYVVNVDSKSIVDTIIPAFTENAIGGMSFGGNRGTLFVSSFTFNQPDSYKIFEINASTGAVVKSFPVSLPVCGVSYSENTKLLYISTATGLTTDHTTYAIDPNTSKVVDQFAGSATALAGDESSL